MARLEAAPLQTVLRNNLTATAKAGLKISE
jgi:hypothetical protein